MAARNWWLTAVIDGRKTVLAGGPRWAVGGFRLDVTQRDRGAIIRAGTLEGRVIEPTGECTERQALVLELTWTGKRQRRTCR